MTEERKDVIQSPPVYPTHNINTIIEGSLYGSIMNLIGNQGLTPTSIVSLLILSSIPEIRKGIVYCSNLIKDKIVEHSDNWYGFIHMRLAWLLGKMFRRRSITPVENVEHEEVPHYRETIEITLEKISLFANFIDHIKNPQNGWSYEEHINDIHINNMQEKFIIVKLTNTKYYDNVHDIQVDCRFSNTLKYRQTPTTYMLNDVGEPTYTLTNGDKDNPQQMTDLIDNRLVAAIIEYWEPKVDLSPLEHSTDNFYKVSKSTKYGMTLGWCFNSGEYNVKFSQIIAMFAACYKQLHKNFRKTWRQMLCLLKIARGEVVFVDNNKILFGTGKYICTIFVDIHMINSNWKMSNCRMMEYPIFKDPDIIPELTIKSSSNTSHKLSITLSSPIEQNLRLWWFNYLTKNVFNQDYVFDSDEVVIYGVKLVHNEETKSVPNPEYAKFTEYKQEMKNMLELQKEDCSTVSMLSSFSEIPDRHITETTITSEVQCTEIKKSIKTMDTLYLRQKDYIDLMGILRNFKECDYLYKKHCIQKKLGLLLSGPPGSGKTTTVLAVASYLKRDIYYVSLNGVETNAQLQMIFDEVNKNKTKRGIIIFEDIDEQTPIVHKRNSEVDVSVSQLLENANDNLDLSYLLNLLDGCLAQDETVFIMTSNHPEKLDPALYRTGRMDMQLHLGLCDHYQISEIYKGIRESDIDPEILNQIPENVFPPAEIIFHILRNIKRNIPDDELMADFIIKQ